MSEPIAYTANHEQHPPMDWLVIVRRGDWRIGVARVKLLFKRRLESGENCPLMGCAYHICRPCPACGRHMAHGPFILGHYSKCLYGSCRYDHMVLEWNRDSG